MENQRQHHVIDDGNGIDQIKCLIDNADDPGLKPDHFFGRERIRILSLDQELSAGGFEYSQDTVKNSGFTAAGRPEKSHEFAGVNFHTDPACRFEFVDLAEIVSNLEVF